MDINEILLLIDKINNTHINELEITNGEFKLRLSKNLVEAATVGHSLQMNCSEDTLSIPQCENESKCIENGTIVKSPLVGIYYESLSPDGKPLVCVGQKLKKGDVLCIIEAMKIFNEIKSPCDGVVCEIFPTNLEVIEYDQKLMSIGEEK